MALLVSALAVAAGLRPIMLLSVRVMPSHQSHFGRAFDACYSLAEGSPLAQYDLGEMYNRGLGVPRDYSEGFSLAAESWGPGISLRRRRPLVICSSKVKVCASATLRPPSVLPGCQAGICRSRAQAWDALCRRLGSSSEQCAGIHVAESRRRWRVCGPCCSC
jgi:hypothetical protein